ncbi:MAG: translation initiation factor IF-2 [Bacteroidales bacterium]|nr:translation initiation factor IF-2 [Bacteroidales bacterium]
MSIEKETRLNKVAKELSVGVSTIVDFLKKKGFEVDNSPNAKITPKQYELLQREYASDQMAKRLSEKEAEIEKERKRAINAEQKANKAANTNQVSNSDKKETKVSDQRQNNNQKPQNQQRNDKHRQKYQEPSIPKVIGKIDLSALNTKTRPDKKSSGQQQQQQDRNRQPQPQPSQQRSDTQQAQPQQTAAEQQQQSQPAAQPQQTAQPASTPTTTATTTTSQPQTESSEVFRPGMIQLTGPKVLGKIELEDSRRRRSRRRRNRQRVDISEATAQQNGGKNSGKNGGKNDKNDQKSGSRSERDRAKDRDRDRQQGGGSGSGKERDRKRNKKQAIQEISQEDIDRQIKEVRAKQQKVKNKAAQRRHDERKEEQKRLQEAMQREEDEKKILKVPEFVSANELAVLMDVSSNDIISVCFDLGNIISVNQRLDADVISLVADYFGFQVQFISEEKEDESADSEEDNPDDLETRAPIVVVMGHVDHGKTKLLDYIRKTNVISGEAGGITQAIGAYNVTLPDGKHITFLDTPGHQAFTAMRARGAKVTDVAVIVVAADSTVMPQTEEAIAHAQAAGVPIVFAITKIDLPTANVDKIKQDLATHGFLVEDWGGKYGCVEISAVTGQNVDALLERILLEAEMLELKANFNCKAKGTVVEATLDKGRGYMATVLVQRGTLKVGDVVWAGSHSGKVKAMFNERGKNIKEVHPAEPASILGLDGSPVAGDRFEVMDEERSARDKAAQHEQLAREISFRTKKHLTLGEIARRIKLGNFKELNIVLKADVQGSVEALQDALEKLSTDQISVSVLWKSVGQISESDVMLASASNAIIIGFEVRPSASAKKLAEKEQIQIKTYSIIYDAINDVQDAMKGMLAPETKEEICGSAEVKEVFRIAKVGNIAGCLVVEGKVLRTNKVRVIREGVVKHTGKIAALKHFKDDAKEINMGMECGIFIENFNDVQVGDTLEAFEEKVVER